MPWIAAAGALGGAALGADAAGDAADAQIRAQREADNLAYSQYLTSLGLQEPWRASGQSALNEINALFGYQQQPYQSATGLAQQNRQMGTASNTRLGAKAIAKMLKSGKSISEIASMGSLKGNAAKKLSNRGFSAQDIGTLQAGPWGQAQTQAAPAQPSAQGPTGLAVFQNSPDYQFRRDEGMRDIGNSFAARGGAFSGNALRGLTDLNNNLASGEYQNFINRRMALAGFGQQGANQQQQAGSIYGQQGSNALMNQGDARASGIANQGNMWGQGLMGAAGAFGNYWGQRNQFVDPAIQNNQYLNQQFPS